MRSLMINSSPWVLKKSESDHCIYIHLKNQLVIGVYVDDLVICGRMTQQIVNIKKQLSMFFPIKDLGTIDIIIGWKIIRNRAIRSLTISQSHYLLEKVQSFGLINAKPYTSPLDGYSGILPARDNELFADESAYVSAIGSLGYASNGTRPDISYATSQLGRFNSAPTNRHWDTACRVLRYLHGTKDYGINYCFGPPSENLAQEFKTVFYSDSDFAGDVTTRRSVSGYILMLGNGPVCWQSRQQKSISTSTAEAEYVALFELSKHTIWVTKFLSELLVANELIGKNGMLAYTDNQSAIAIAKGTNSPKTKHIDIAYHFVRQCVKDKLIDLEYIPTNEMLADILTKPLSQSKTKHYVSKS